LSLQSLFLINNGKCNVGNVMFAVPVRAIPDWKDNKIEIVAPRSVMALSVTEEASAILGKARFAGSVPCHFEPVDGNTVSDGDALEEVSDTLPLDILFRDSFRVRTIKSAGIGTQFKPFRTYFCRRLTKLNVSVDEDLAERGYFNAALRTHRRHFFPAEIQQPVEVVWIVLEYLSPFFELCINRETSSFLCY
jgi:hypothetical protein